MREVWAVVAAGLLVSCTGDRLTPPQPQTCGDRLTAWDALRAERRIGENVPLDPRLLRPDRERDNPDAFDGDPGTVATYTAPDEIVIRLDWPLRVTGLRYTAAPGGPALTDFEVSLGIDADCYDERPLVVGAFDGSDATQEATFDGRVATHLRISFLGSSAADGSLTVADFVVLVDGGFVSTPPAFAAPDVEWAYRPVLTIGSADSPTFELRAAPEGMMVAGNEIRWTPRADQFGVHDVELAARARGNELVQRFTVAVASSRVVATGTVPRSTGGTVTVMGSGTEADGVEIVVPPTEGSGDVTVEVSVLEGDLPAPPEATGAVGPAFSVRVDVPDDTELEFRVGLASITGLPPDADPEGVFFAAYGLDPMDDPGGGVADGWFITATRRVGSVITGIGRGVRRAFYRIVYGPNTVTVRRDEFTVKLLLDADEPRDGRFTPTVELIASQLVTDRTAIMGMGCTFRTEQSVVIRTLPGVIGWVLPNAGELELNREYYIDMTYPDDRWRDTIAHELTHVFQFLNSGASPFVFTEHWWLEGTAVYNADEVVNLDAWRLKYPPFTEAVTRLGIQDTTDARHRYRNVSFFKSLKAQRGGFNVCDLMRARSASGTGIAGLASMVGGSDGLLQAYATYVAGYNFIRTEAVLEDAALFFPSGTAEFAASHNYSGSAEYHWTETTSAVPGGHSARFHSPQTPRPVTVEVLAPTMGYLARIYDSTHAQLGELRPGAAPFEIADPSGGFYVVLALAQDSMTPFASSAFDVVLRTEVDCASLNTCEPCAGSPDCIWCRDAMTCISATDVGMCSDVVVASNMCMPRTSCGMRGQPCSGSGPAFDSECCMGMICVVGACQLAEGGREQASCESASCAVGLACRSVGMEGVPPTCCARNTDYCEEKADCCGLMDCVGNRCVGRNRGEACLVGDCVGASFCDGGTCR